MDEEQERALANFRVMLKGSKDLESDAIRVMDLITLRLIESGVVVYDVPEFSYTGTNDDMSVEIGIPCLTPNNWTDEDRAELTAYLRGLA